MADEAYAVQVVDGVGRVIGSAANHPANNGGYSAQMTIYDLMGRAIKTSNPAEITEAWIPTGDDVAGWLYTQQSYDWQGRPLITTNPDATTREASYSAAAAPVAQGDAHRRGDLRRRNRKVTAAKILPVK